MTLDLRTRLLGVMALRRTQASFPWYDGGWLRQYEAALLLIDQVKPSLRPAFVDAMAPLRTAPGFRERLVAAPFGEEVLHRMRAIIRDLPSSQVERHEIGTFGRGVVHDHPWFTELQRAIVPLACELAGEAVEPTYNFLSLYDDLGVCPPHLDTPISKWTLDLCIEQSEAWPIHFSKVVPWPEGRAYAVDDWRDRVLRATELDFRSWSLRPGEALWFSGSSQWHYRERLETRSVRPFCHLLFFHFMPAGLADVAEPANWPRLFDCPELAAVVSPDPDAA